MATDDQPLPYRIAVLCYLYDDEGRVLLLHRDQQPNIGMYSPVGGKVDIASGEDQEGPRQEIDPDFLVYRVLPPDQIIPTIAGTFGRGGLTVDTVSDREEVKEFPANLSEKRDGEKLLIIGHAAIQKKASLIAQCANPIVVVDGEDRDNQPLVEFVRAEFDKAWDAARGKVLYPPPADEARGG